MMTNKEKVAVAKLIETVKICIMHDVEFDASIFSGSECHGQPDLSYINIYELNQNRRYIDEKGFIQRMDKFIVYKKLESYRLKNPEDTNEVREATRDY